jgi:hypothetical protein
MSRKSTQTTEVTMNALDEVINTPVNFQFDETAEKLGIGEPELRERLESKLNSADVHTWDTIPVEHQAVIDAIVRDLDAERSTRKLEPETETPQLPKATEQPLDIPVIEDAGQPTRRRGRPKKESTALTKTKSTKLKESDKNSQQLAASDQEVKVALHARKGQKAGAQLATIELAAEDATYRQIKGQALVRKVGQLTSEIASESDFDPIKVLKDLGINPNSEIFEDLREQIEPALGKLESATAEIVDNAWVNGIDLGVELSQLDSLMNCSGSTSDYWQ